MSFRPHSFLSIYYVVFCMTTFCAKIHVSKSLIARVRFLTPYMYDVSMSPENSDLVMMINLLFTDVISLIPGVVTFSRIGAWVLDLKTIASICMQLILYKIVIFRPVVQVYSRRFSSKRLRGSQWWKHLMLILFAENQTARTHIHTRIYIYIYMNK